jgi:uncharacterized membrane protein
MKRFALGSAFSFRGRQFYGPLRGFDGKPFHPPLTDVPVGAYVIAAILDLVAFSTGGRDTHIAAGYVFLVGAAFSLPTSLTGFADWLRMRAGSEVRRITNTHAVSMVIVTGLVAADLGWRYSQDAERTGGGLLALSLSILVVLTLGAAIGGSLVFDKGYRVRKRPPEAQGAAPPSAGAS